MSPGRPALLVANTAGFARSDLVRLDWDQDRLPSIFDSHTGRTLPVQRSGQSVVFVAPDLPAKGLRCYDLLTDGESIDVTAAATTLCVSASHLENRFFAIDLDAQGQISRLFDKQAGRDVLAPGCCGNEIRAYEDKPMQHQNWDIDIYYQQKSWPVDDVSALEVVEQGPVQAAVRVSRAFLNSRIVQTIRIYAEIARIDFATEIDWHEDELLLKAAFPVDIHADTATYDIQFGNVTRPTHWNTSWDWARFEVCAQKWADLSEEGYGVSLLNDSKYGHDIRDNCLRLTLLKSGMAPNPQADREQHHFVYALYPHGGSWRQAGTMAQAYSLNLPLYACRVGSLAGSTGPAANRSAFALCQIDEPGHVMLETIKRAEDGDGLILRLFEYTNWRGPVRLAFASPLQAVSVCDLLERPLAALQTSGSAVSCPFRPYEIKTLRVHLADGS
jgi:alpha-mannosidase